MWPIYALRAPWTADQMERHAARFGLHGGARAVGDRLVWSSPEATVEIYRASLSFRWTAGPAASGKPVPTDDAIAALASVARDDITPLLPNPETAVEEPYEILPPAIRSDGAPRIGLERMGPPAGSAAALFTRPSTTVGHSLGVRYAVRGASATWGGRLRVDLDPQRRVQRAYLFWQEPIPEPVAEVRTLSLEVFAEASSDGLDGRPSRHATLGYLIGPPGSRKRVLVPVYRYVIDVRPAPLFRYATAFRLRDAPHINPDVLGSLGGDVRLL